MLKFHVPIPFPLTTHLWCRARQWRSAPGQRSLDTSSCLDRLPEWWHDYIKLWKASTQDTYRTRNSSLVPLTIMEMRCWDQAFKIIFNQARLKNQSNLTNAHVERLSKWSGGVVHLMVRPSPNPPIAGPLDGCSLSQSVFVIPILDTLLTSLYHTTFTRHFSLSLTHL